MSPRVRWHPLRSDSCHKWPGKFFYPAVQDPTVSDPVLHFMTLAHLVMNLGGADLCPGMELGQPCLPSLDLQVDLTWYTWEMRDSWEDDQANGRWNMVCGSLTQFPLISRCPKNILYKCILNMKNMVHLTWFNGDHPWTCRPSRESVSLN